MFYTEDEPNYENEVEYLYETLTVIGADGEYILIEIDVVLTDGKGNIVGGLGVSGGTEEQDTALALYGKEIFENSGGN